MFKTKLKTLAAAVALAGATSAMAAPLPITITNADGSFTSLAGFDWHALGTAAVYGFTPVTGDTFTINFWATATSLSLETAPVPEGGLVKTLGDAGSYEYTVFGTLNETATCSDPANCNFFVNSGSFAVYYDTTPDGNYKTGAGITDGVKIFSGTVGAQPGGSFTAINPTNGFGVSALLASITQTDPAYISPDLAGANTITTLQIGPLFNTNGWLPGDISGTPGADGASNPFGPNNLPTLILQADMNTGVTSIPEPGILALVGLGLAGIGAARRRKAA
jgi:hypothetical protein